LWIKPGKINMDMARLLPFVGPPAQFIKPATKYIQLRPYRSSAGLVFGRSAPPPNFQATLPRPPAV
jgi:hypothetical protein